MKGPLKHLLFIAIVLLPAAAWAAFPRPTGFVNDFAGIISPDNKTRLEQTLSAFERASGDEVAVVTLPSLEGQPVEDVAVKLFKEWGVGKKGKDNGILFLVAPNDRKMRIEVGYGLEGTINDALAGRILDEAAIPRFRAGDMDGGIAAGTLAIVGTISHKEGLGFDVEQAYGAQAAQLGSPAVKKPTSPMGTVGKIILFLIMGYVFIRHPWLFLLFLGGMGRGGRAGGGFSGGFGGFGGGLSGGGGASRGW